MNKSKTNVMMENATPIYINNIQIKKVESYINLGQRNSTRKKLQRESKKIAFAKHSFMLDETNPQLTRARTSQARNKLAAAQTKMEMGMLNIT